MGMFDDLRCDYPLPAPNCEGLSFQTKDTPAQYLDLYTITADGELLEEEYETVDRSDPKAEGFMALIGCATRVNKRAVPCLFTGEICFYTSSGGGWLEFSSYFKAGKLQQVNLLEDTRPKPPTP